MFLSKVLSLALVAAVTSARPGLNNPTRVIRRDPPAPSAFPLGDACEHEWQYLNFNPNDATDRAHLQRLHDVICDGSMRAVSSFGELAAESVLAPYKRYFPESEGEDDTETFVAEVLALITGTSSSDGAIGAIVGTFVVDNLGKFCFCSGSSWRYPSLIRFADFGVKVPGAKDCTKGDTLAYTLTDQLDGREKIHFCDPSWTRGSIADVDCASLDPFPSEKMDAFERIVLHEMTHYSSVGPKTSLGSQIVDVLNKDGASAYDPPRVHGLIDEAQDDQPGLPEINADSYAWMSLDAKISHMCLPRNGVEWEKFFTENPPPYE